MSISVAIDIDGVLADSFKLYQQIADKEGVTGQFDKAYNGIFKVYTESNELFGDVLFGKYRENVINDVDPMEGALEAFDKFVTNDKIIPYIVTARYPDSFQQTKDWLHKHGFKHYQDLLFFKDKLKAPCQVVIDDKPSTIESYIENARMGIIHDAPYNRGLKKGTRVKNLNEAYNYLLRYL